MAVAVGNGPDHWGAVHKTLHWLVAALVLGQAVLGVVKSIHHLGTLMHQSGAVALMLLIALHVAGALRHELVLRDSTLRRMLPLAPRRQPPEAIHHG